MSYLLVLASGLLGGVLGGWLHGEIRFRQARAKMLGDIVTEFHVKREDPGMMLIPWDVKTATITSGWRKMPDA